MSSMYWYCAFQSSEEFSALDTSRMAISFFAGSSSPIARTEAVACDGFRNGAAARVAPNNARAVRRGVGCLTGPPEEWGWGELAVQN